MPRIRYIKPDFFTDDDLGKLSPLHRLVFAGLWCYADREGRLKDKPAQLKVQVLPFDHCDINEILDELSKSKPINNHSTFITRYEVNGEKYIQINNFLKHQKPHHTEQSSVIPPISSVKARLKHRVQTVTTREGMGKGMGKGMGMEKGMGKGMGSFDVFWKAYPNKKSKGYAEKVFLKINPSEQLLAEMLAKIEQAKTSVEWTKDNGRFIPYPATWLNAKGWEDEYNQPKLSDQGIVSEKTQKSLEAGKRWLHKGKEENAQS